MRGSVKIFFVTLLAVLVVGCAETGSIQSGSYKYLYDYDSRVLHPEFIIYHHSDDSSTVFFRVHSSELLYTRNDAQTPFVARLKIVTSIGASGSAVGDTTSLEITEAMESRQGWLIGNYKVAMPAGNWQLKIEFNDLAKKATQQVFLTADKSTRYNAQNYLVRKFEYNEPLFTGFATPGQKVEVISARNEIDSFATIYHLTGEMKLPPPPFSGNAPELPNLSVAKKTEISRSASGAYVFVVENGSYFLTNDNEALAGTNIKTSGTFYPKVKEADALQWPLRYITTKSEHEEIVRNNYPKKLVDKFWIECAGSKEHARELIRIFYHRVEEANYYFSSYTEGWRTDRGMIHLIFGNPTRVLRFDSGETWQYGEEGTAGMLSFVFHKIDSPLSSNIYMLDRDAGYKPFWERMVQTWRNGRVYSD